ncbi:MAG: hypothetical protein EBT48_01730 [Verrucomicrobia bacterium]|nr:hypothetical protein [Verrucomicrobiota bacterium]
MARGNFGGGGRNKLAVLLKAKRTGWRKPIAKMGLEPHRPPPQGMREGEQPTLDRQVEEQSSVSDYSPAREKCRSATSESITR